MRNILLLLTIIGYNISFAQPGWLRGDFGSTWSDYQLQNRGVVMATTLKATTTNANAGFLFTRDLSYNPKWCGSTTNYVRTKNQKLTDAVYYFTSGSWDHDLTVAIENNKYYTFIVGKNTTSNNDLAILETDFQPVNIVAVQQTPATNVFANEQVTVSVTLNAPKNNAEKVFIRYSTNNWVSSTAIEITAFDSNNIGTAVIPGFPAGTAVSYYALTTTQTSVNPADIDYYTLAINNNGNQNYSYTVMQDSGCPFSVNLGNDTAVCAATVITLNPNVLVSPYGDTLVITYNAAAGMGSLVNAQKVYMHAGAELHPNGGWQYVKGNWGQDDGVGLMTSLGNNLWQIKINPVTYFGYPADSSLNGVFMVFRNADGSVVGKDDNGNDIWVNMQSQTPVSSFSGVMPVFFKNPIDSIRWSDNSTGQTLVVSQSGTYWVYVHNSNGCFASDTINVSINGLPIVDIGDYVETCTSKLLDAGPGFVSYQWSTGATTQSITVDTTGSYFVTVTDANGCSAFDMVYVVRQHNPVAKFSTNITGWMVNFIDESLHGESYQWDFNGDNIVDSQTAGNVVYTYPAAGQYNAKLTVSNDCGTSNYTKVITVVGSSITENPAFVLNQIPNPAKGTVKLNLPADIKIENITISNVLGEKQSSFSLNENSKQLEISFDDFTDGVYFISLKYKDKVITRKIFINNK